MTATETVSYSLVILAGLGVALAAAWAVLKGASLPPGRVGNGTLSDSRHRTLSAPIPHTHTAELVFEPKEYTVFGLALERCCTHSVVAVRLGSPLTGYGVESNNRSARQRIRHKLGTDAQGRPTVTVQFQLRGPRGVATVLAEATQDADSPGGWRLNYVQCSDPHGHMAPIQVISPFEHQAAGGGAASQAGGFALGGAASGRA